MRSSWWVGLLFLIPCLALSLLVNAALFLERGVLAPWTFLGVLVVPVVGVGGGVKRAFIRGLFSLAILSLVFCAVVRLRMWTDAGAAVLEREGLVGLSNGALGLGVLCALAGWWLSRRETTPHPTS